ncbi:undecaprenyldiphospho-muramoylpentapeptide beta-N-acetylglucosaminyltransferase [Sediminitomix flava]|uniref:UDP-N-acetylglucosamine--N-acetylmuramyl-(pentapeptide) pyrophosphoryl-undecaprenol N-acetylglucosamine transferase n=1 Tax=Sediminitomix flava TaxID=379075 RepID=A0A315ZA69_SEDFL|nr:undecaprenyldiphospho-muramoylpentapeptide beta-N-acetylglucosaminyltransferase [Sediminitomix flava]PWJ42069.1 UDP-N-acetylglucosamine-N-acetylmuramylpentapeptide N-acetylglucosamine transferase [Sediminitomix flava]
MEKYKLIISGGGTGGHVYPAIAIADAFKARFPDSEILFVGAEGKMEMEKVPEAGYPIEGLKISGLQRKLTVDNLSFPFKVISSLFKAKKIISKFKPDAVVGVGGYASAPIMEMAVRNKIPTVIQEQNGYAGLVNKIVANRASKICVAYPKMEKYFPADKLVMTGNPVRKDIIELAHLKEEAYTHFELSPEKKTVFVFGGSLGALTLNESMFNGFQRLLDEGYQLIWQTGKYYYEKYKDLLPNELPEGLKLLPFIRRMDLAYACSDLVISRAGALSISELCLAKLPTLLVPSPNVAEDHQTKNAMNLVNEGAAVMVKDIDAREKLIDEALVVLGDEKWQNSLKESMGELAKPEAANEIVDEIYKLIQK